MKTLQQFLVARPNKIQGHRPNPAQPVSKRIAPQEPPSLGEPQLFPDSLGGHPKGELAKSFEILLSGPLELALNAGPCPPHRKPEIRGGNKDLMLRCIGSDASIQSQESLELIKPQRVDFLEQIRHLVGFEGDGTL